MSKAKVEVAREHLQKAQAEAVGGDVRDAIRWSRVAASRPGARRDMSLLAGRWLEVPAVRGGLSRNHPRDPACWADRLFRDRRQASLNQTSGLSQITAEVEGRCRSLGAEALILSGSTARARRTSASDLDYHVVGAKPDLGDLPEDIDLYTHAVDEFDRKLVEGDDFVHWSIWFGCVLIDLGMVQTSAVRIVDDDLWPDVTRKEHQAHDTLRFAKQLIESGDYAAALEQTRGALSLTARWHLLAQNVFPLARDELPEQLCAVGQRHLAENLHLTIHHRPPLADLAEMVNVSAAVQHQPG